MKIERLLVPSLVIASLPLVLALRPRGDGVGFQPDEGVRLEKELGIELTFHLEDVSMSMNGQEMPAEMMGDTDQALVLEALLKVTDEFVASARGKHLELLRTFEEVALEGGPEGETESADDVGELEGTTVRFKWDEEEEAYVKTFSDGAGDEDALADLSPDMDFLVLLPDGEVDPDETWSVTGAKLATVFLPGGMLPLPDPGDGGEVMQVLEDELEPLLTEAFSDFEVRCTYTGSREEEGRRLGEIGLEFADEASLDLSDLLMTIVELQAGRQETDIEADILGTLDLEMKGEGTLLWDLAARRVHGFKMDLELTLLADVEADISAMGESQSIALSAEISGDGKWNMSTAAAE